jgi:hypothetical protein
MIRLIVALGSIVFFMYISYNVGHYEGNKAGMKSALSTQESCDEEVEGNEKQAIMKEKK